MYHTLQDIIRTKGTAGLYVGIRISLFQTFCSNFGYFWFYALVRKLYFKYFKTKNTAIELILGAIAGGLSRAFTTPISVVTTRMQVGDKDKTYSAIAKDIIEKEGIPGLWRGFSASLVLTINPAITLQADERYKGVLDCGFKTLKMEGLLGLYSGMHSQLAKAVLCQALLFLLKESLTKSKK
ncbi:ADP/ATP carrier protein [Boothiomyces sp. JEL0866]|nr:ADP/ATP carrier protein [Boothiomyces sp. JEL0866]